MNFYILDIIKNISVHGYEEEGTITTSFDMRVLNEIDRYHLVIDAVSLLNLDSKVIKEMEDKLLKHHNYIREHGVDMPEVDEWKW